MNQAGFAPIIAQPRRWDFLEGLMKQLELKTFVEVGCKEGRTTGHILKTVPDARVIAIDPWVTQEASGDPTRETYKDWDFSKIEAEFWENVGEDKDRCTMLRLTSEEAAARFTTGSGRSAGGFDLVVGEREAPGGGSLPAVVELESLDLVFIDALHDHDSVKHDIELWWPLVRVGGVLAGHDFNHKWPGVERAVSEFFSLMDVGVATDSVWFVVKR